MGRSPSGMRCKEAVLPAFLPRVTYLGYQSGMGRICRFVAVSALVGCTAPRVAAPPEPVTVPEAPAQPDQLVAAGRARGADPAGLVPTSVLAGLGHLPDAVIRAPAQVVPVTPQAPGLAPRVPALFLPLVLLLPLFLPLPLVLPLVLPPPQVLAPRIQRQPVPHPSARSCLAPGLGS